MKVVKLLFYGMPLTKYIELWIRIPQQCIFNKIRVSNFIKIFAIENNYRTCMCQTTTCYHTGRIWPDQIIDILTEVIVASIITLLFGFLLQFYWFRHPSLLWRVLRIIFARMTMLEKNASVIIFFIRDRKILVWAGLGKI